MRTVMRMHTEQPLQTRPAVTAHNGLMASSSLSNSASQPSSQPDSASPLVAGVGPELIKLRDKLPQLQHPNGSPVRALVVDD